MPVIGEVRVNVPAIRRELENKISARDALNGSIRSLEATLETILQFQIGESNSPQNDKERASSLPTGKSVFDGKTMAEIALLVLSESKGPMRVKNIVDEMISQGYEADDRAKLQNAVFTSMDRKKDVFIKVEAGLWDLCEGVAVLDGGLSQ